MHANNGQKTAAVFLDTEKVFDHIWHESFLHKLHAMGTPTYHTKIIDLFLKNITLSPSDDFLSSSRLARFGVPQSLCLAPILYIILTNNILLHQNASLSLFVDDTLLYTRDKNPKRAIAQHKIQLEMTKTWFDK